MSGVVATLFSFVIALVLSIGMSTAPAEAGKLGNKIAKAATKAAVKGAIKSAKKKKGGEDDEEEDDEETPAAASAFSVRTVSPDDVAKRQAMAKQKLDEEAGLTAPVATPTQGASEAMAAAPAVVCIAGCWR